MIKDRVLTTRVFFAVVLLSVGSCVVAMIVSPFVGPANIDFRTALTDSSSLDFDILFRARLPRTLFAAMVGGALAMLDGDAVRCGVERGLVRRDRGIAQADRVGAPPARGSPADRHHLGIEAEQEALWLGGAQRALSRPHDCVVFRNSLLLEKQHN